MDEITNLINYRIADELNKLSSHEATNQDLEKSGRLQAKSRVFLGMNELKEKGKMSYILKDKNFIQIYKELEEENLLFDYDLINGVITKNKNEVNIDNGLTRIRELIRTFMENNKNIKVFEIKSKEE